MSLSSMDKKPSKFDILLDNPRLCSEHEHWRIEDGSENIDEGSCEIYHAPVIENQEKDVLWYYQYFSKEVHYNYIGLDEVRGPFVLSYKPEEGSNWSVVRVILWLSEGIERRLIHIKSKSNASAQEILKKMNPLISKKRLKEVKSDDLKHILLKIEESTAEMKKSFKFGVLYTKKGQKTEEEFFGNKEASQDFENFINILGTKIQLKNWNRYSGGLDTEYDRTGKNSVFLDYCGYEIMFHISTLLPWTRNDPQQIERKKHIGNDIVIIIFQDRDSDDLWSPSLLSSKFPHIYAVVRCEGNHKYRVALSIKNKVNKFGPPLPHPPIFTDPILLRNFLIAKLINGEREVLRSVPDFRQIETLQSYLREIYENFNKSTPLKNKLVGDMLRRSQTFSLKSSSFLSTQAFQVKTIYESFPVNITCSDSYQGKLILGTPDGLFYIYYEIDNRNVYRIKTRPKKSSHYIQINVIENLGILLCLIQKIGVVVYDLNSLEDHDGPDEFIIEKSKHSSFYSYGVYQNTLYLCCVKNAYLLFYRWVDDQFIPHQKIELPEKPKVVEFTNNGDVIVAFDNEFSMFNIGYDDPVLIPFYTFKDQIPIDVVFLENDEYLLCFHNLGIFVNRDGVNKKGYDIKWNSKPNYFVFTSFNIEVRAVSNGALLQTILSDSTSSHIKFLTSINGIFFAVNSSSSSIIKQLRIVAQQNFLKVSQSSEHGLIKSNNHHISINGYITDRSQSMPVFKLNYLTISQTDGTSSTSDESIDRKLEYLQLSKSKKKKKSKKKRISTNQEVSK